MRLKYSLLTCLALVGTTVLGADSPPPESPPTLEVLGRYPLPAESDRVIVDLRWSGRDTVYLADFRRVAEVKLAEGLPEIGQPLPAARFQVRPCSSDRRSCA